MRTRRRSLSAQQHALRSNLAASAITRLAAFKSGARVAIYLPFDRETNTAVLLIAAQRRGIHLYLPVIWDLRHSRLRFYPVSGKTRRGVFGISVPHRNGCATPPRWFNLVVVPLVGVTPSQFPVLVGAAVNDTDSLGVVATVTGCAAGADEFTEVKVSALG